MIPPRVSFVTLGARDLDGLRSFYRRLGWEVAIEAENLRRSAPVAPSWGRSPSTTS